MHDVAESDAATPINVVASYEDGVHVLRPKGMPIDVRWWREGDRLRWQYVGFTVTLEHIGGPDADPADIPI